MTGNPHTKFVGDRPFADPAVAMRRMLEYANGMEAHNGRVPIGPINRTLLNEGASPAEYIAGIELAIAEDFLELHQSGGYVMFTQKGAERFAQGHATVRPRSWRPRVLFAQTQGN